MIFAAPPYFLSNDGISVQSGKIVSVNKGEWNNMDKRYISQHFFRSQRLATVGLQDS